VGLPFATPLETAALFIKVLILTKLIVRERLPTVKFLSPFLNAFLSVSNRLD